MSPELWWPMFFKPGMKRSAWPIVLLVGWLMGAAEAKPPVIIRQPPHELLFYVPSVPGEATRPFLLECRAVGNPKPNYNWTKNNKDFDYASQDGRILQQRGSGTLVFTAPDDRDEGLYQCRAFNEHGTSVSNVVLVRKAELNSFPDEDPKNVSVKEGEPFSLHCDPPTGFPRPYVSWFILFKNGAIRAINSSRITADPDGGLHFSSVDLGDALDDAVYACSVMSTFMHQYKLGNKIRLHVEPVSKSEESRVAPVQQYVSQENIVALRGSKVRLFCIYGGTPIPKTAWSKGGVKLPSPRFTYKNDDKTLIIESVQFEDEGTYECRIDNGVGAFLRHTMNLKVEAAPYWLNVEYSMDAAEGEKVVYKCDVMGLPKPNLEWFVNGVPISSAEPNTRRTVLGNVLTVESLEKSDTAVYQCNASNPHGYVFRNFFLNVGVAAPSILGTRANTTAVMGSRVTFRCRVIGAPRPHVMWFKDGRDLTGGRHVVQESNDLQISDLQFPDEGEYVCVARNKFGQSSLSATLHVQRRTRITSRPEDLQVAQGKTARFRCAAETDPRRDLSIEWLFNGELLDINANPRLAVQSDNTLVVTQTLAQDAGIYTCVARTHLDNDSADATLVVQDVPTPPQLLHVQCDNRVALVEWRPTGESRTPIVSYAIQHNTGFNPEKWEDTFVNIPASDTMFKVALSPWTNYTFRVLASNEVGFSKPSETSVMCATPEDVPYKNPDNVHERDDHADNLVISWTPMPPVEHNAPDFFYRVFWKRADQPEAVWTSRNIEDWKQDKHTVKDQPTFKPYRIKVEAHNRKGQANTAAAEVIGYSGEGVPLAAPVNFRLVRLLGSRSAEFAWSPVDPESVRGHLSGYKIETWTPEEGERMQRELVVAANTTTAIVSLFRPYSRNLVRLRVFNDKHDGPATDFIEYLTPEGSPGPVASLEAVSLGSTALHLLWKPPAEPNGVLTGYRIYYRELVGTQFGPTMERPVRVSDPLVLHAKLAGLKPRTTYHIAIRATTAAGLGEAYILEASTGYLSERVPDVPDFTWVHLPDSNDKEVVQVTWVPTVDGYPVTNFYVQYRLKGNETWESTMVEEYEDNVVVHGLEQAVYEFRVVAVDGKHERPSMVKQVDLGVPEKQAFIPDPTVSTSKTLEKDDPLEASASGRQLLVDSVERARADMLACHERAMDQNQRYSSTLLAGLDRQARALEDLKVAVQNGFAELQRSQQRLSQRPPERSPRGAT